MSDISNLFDGDISNEAIQAWLEQFEKEDRFYILKLLKAFKYLSSKRVACLVKELYKAISSELAISQERIWFVPVGYVAKSGSIIAYYFRIQNNISQNRFIAPADIASLSLNKNDVVVFLDDFIGSGNQASQVWQKVVVPVKKNSDCKFVYAVLLGYQNGLENVKASTGFITYAVEVLTVKDMPFSPQGNLFEDEKERKKAKDVVKKYGLRLYPNHPLGYKESQGLIGFFYSTPNNSLPIFWSSEEGWKPILTRGESYRDPAFLIGPPPGLKRESTYNSPRKALVDSEELDRYDIDPDIATKIFSEFQKAAIFLILAPVLKEMGIKNEVFSDMLRIISILKHYEHEKQPVCSALLMVPNEVPEELIGDKMLSVRTNVSLESTAEILSLANLVNGFNGSIACRPDGQIMGNYLYQEEEYIVDRFLPKRYYKAAIASNKNSGLLFLFSGDGRVTVFHKGQRILSHRGATWHFHATQLEKGIRELSITHQLNIAILQEIFRLSFYLSDKNQGALITVGDHERVLDLSDPPKTEYIKWVDMKLTATPEEAILGLMSQDGATIVSENGRIIQVMTFLRPPARISAEEEVGKGSKHNTAVKMSRITNAICIAVSVDGMVTVYSKGAIAFKMMG